jgi:tetratricopeptide (TPR) repeat protein
LTPQPTAASSQSLETAADSSPAADDATGWDPQAEADPEPGTTTAPQDDVPEPISDLQSNADPQETASDWNELGNRYTGEKRYDKAFHAYKKAILLDPTYGSPYSNLGLLYYQSGQYQIAVQLYQKSIDLLERDEDKALTWNRIGDAYRRLRDYPSAMAAYRKASEINPLPGSVLSRARFSMQDSYVA